MKEMEPTAKFVTVCWAVVTAFWVVSAFWVKRTKERQPLPGRLLYLGLTVLVVMLLKGEVQKLHLDRPLLPHTLATGILADLIVLLGLWIAIWARVTLGGNWSSSVTLKEGHELIQRGPYRLIRHPIYSGLLLMVLGTAILVGRTGGFFAFLICFCALWVKARREELLLTKNLPGYPEYMARTKALIPSVL
jgi:protein-S-isoprenylcysteine O-methyltransferase Ste14